ncbi:MAG: DUF3540 domain-containing protein [Caldilinea sp.]|nr:DUF3540 domain-containing protein [Caldilinea sp.]
MAQPAELLSLTRDADDLYLGPAHVIEPGLREVRLRLEDGREITGELALALPYRAAEQDVVVVMGRGDRHYVVGLLHGQGKTSLSFRGDVELHAVGGRVAIHGDQGVHVSGDELTLEAQKLKVVADGLVQRFNSVVQQVRGLFSSRVERAHVVVDETAFAKTKSTTMLSDESVTINGEQIHLG